MSLSSLGELGAARWPKHLSLLVLIGYWCLLFAATHVPVPPRVPMGPSDKLLHLGAYAVLGLLLAVAWSMRSAFGWRQCLLALAVLAAFGIFDELTQIPVGRQAELVDWWADVAGSAAGLALFLAARRLWRGFGQTLGVGGR